MEMIAVMLVGIAVLACLIRLLGYVNRIADDARKVRVTLEEQLRIQNLQGDAQLQMSEKLREISGYVFTNGLRVEDINARIIKLTVESSI